jgi:hypothetical protein
MMELDNDNGSEYGHIMSRESYLGKADRKHLLFLTPIAGGNYGLNLLAPAFFVAGYIACVVFAPDEFGQITTLDLIILIIHATLCVYCVLLGFLSWSTDTSRLSENIQNKINHNRKSGDNP